MERASVTSSIPPRAGRLLPNGFMVTHLPLRLEDRPDSAHATRLTARMAQLVKGEAVYLPVSGVLASEAARDILAADEAAQQAIRLYDQVTIALVGIGAIAPSPLLAQSGNIFAPKEYDSFRLEKRVIAMFLEQFSEVVRAIGVTSGSRKFPLKTFF